MQFDLEATRRERDELLRELDAAADAQARLEVTDPLILSRRGRANNAPMREARGDGGRTLSLPRIRSGSRSNRRGDPRPSRRRR
jgi:hypothetical protein